MYLSPKELAAKIAEGGWRISRGELARKYLPAKPGIVTCRVEEGAYGMVTVTFVLDIEHCSISIGAFGARFKLVGPPHKPLDTVIVRKRNVCLQRGGPHASSVSEPRPAIVTILTLHNPGIRLLHQA